MRFALIALACLLLPAVRAEALGTQESQRPFTLQKGLLAGTQVEVCTGTYDVYENREARTGRVIGLHVVVLPALGPDPEPDPVFLLAGGPGQAATTFARSAADSWIRQERDIVLVDQRGTGRSNPLGCTLADASAGPQGYLDQIFQPDRFRDCLVDLRARADLTLYSTPIAMDDLDEVRVALGYDRINLIGGSYGTRAALIYMQRHPEAVRTAVLKGVAPTALKNPLHHARGAQDSLDWVLNACAGDPACKAAFPRLGAELDAVLTRLESGPAAVPLTGEDGSDHTVSLDRRAFAEALRVMLYSTDGASRVPALIHRAFQGDLEPFAREGIAVNRGLRNMLTFGMLLCVTCTEDVARIQPEEVRAATAGTFLGDRRVISQSAVCSFWPKSSLPADYAEPVTCEAPVLVVSGVFDPVTPPRFGEEAARHLPNSVHVVTPRAHDLVGPCIDSMTRSLIESASTAGLDTSCVEQMPTIRFQLPL